MNTILFYIYGRKKNLVQRCAHIEFIKYALLKLYRITSLLWPFYFRFWWRWRLRSQIDRQRWLFFLFRYVWDLFYNFESRKIPCSKNRSFRGKLIPLIAFILYRISQSAEYSARLMNFYLWNFPPAHIIA